MATAFQFDHRIEFLPDNAEAILRTVVAGPGVFALCGADEHDQPYLTRGADLRRRLRRLLAPPEAVDEQGRPVLSKRLNLRERVRWIEWTATGSEFESAVVLYCATRAAFGELETRRRMRLHAPYFLRVTMEHQHPRVYSTNKLSTKSLGESFGPYPSRAAAERHGDAVLDLFKLRRCWEDLVVSPDHPGCAYGEMKKCMEPCKGACTAEEYSAEAARVRAFFATRGESMLTEIAAQREAASEAMDFEAAAALHKQWEKVRAAAVLADELVRPVTELRAVVVQAAAKREDAGEEAALFLLAHGRIAGPERLSTLGVRAVREQTAVGSSLFAQPLMLAAVPLEDSQAEVSATVSPEDRAKNVLARLEARAADHGDADIGERCDYLALFRRWYYRPEKQRAGEVFLPNLDHSWPLRRILNGAARVVLGPPKEAPPVDREGFKTKKLHEGREGVEREVVVLPKRTRSRKSLPPTEDSLK